MYGRSDVNVKVERGSTFTFRRGFSYIVSILYTHVKPVKVYVRTQVKITRQFDPPSPLATTLLSQLASVLQLTVVDCFLPL